MSRHFRFLELVPTVEEYQYLRNSVGWPKVNNQAVEIALKNSLYSVCVYKEDKLSYRRSGDLLLYPRYDCIA
jgi:hypothetical protein